MTSATPSREAFERWWESDEAFAHRHEETQEQAWAAWQARDAEIAELRKQLEWQPIETVGSQAKDMDVELLTESGKVRIETVRYALHQIAAAKADGETPFFTHWKPLPAPPEQGEG